MLPFLPSYFTGFARATSDMARGLRADSYDALLTNDNVAIFFARAVGRIPNLHDFDATPVQIDRMPGYGSPHDPEPIARLKYSLWCGFMHRSTVMQAWSNWARESAISDYGVPPERVFINPPGVDLQQWRPSPDPSQAQGQRPLRVLFVGADFQRKGGDLLLEWFRSRQSGGCELHLVTREPVRGGQGVYVYNSMQPNSPELMQLYYQSDLFVLPSRAECFGIATVEAMSTGLPVITSDVGGVHDIVEPGRNGYIVPSEDIRSLGAAIERILGDASLREIMCKESRVLAEQRFDVQKNARRTLATLKQIIEDRRGVSPVTASGHT